MAGISQTFLPSVLLAIFAGVVVSLVFGIIPGIGGITAIVMVLPFTFGMDPRVALCLLIALQSCGATGGSVTAVLIGVPGISTSAATLLDGFPLTKKGQGGRAVGAALAASGLGGLAGGVVLALLIPVAYPIVMLFGSGEIGLVAIVGLCFIAVLTRGSTLKGLAAGFMGMLLGLVGAHPLSGVIRKSPKLSKQLRR